MASAAPFFSSAPPDLLQAALEVSLTGLLLFRPVYGAPDPATITDLAYVYLNPAAQHLLHLPEHSADSFLTLYPHAVDAGIFAFYRDTFLAGGSGRYDVNYQHDGLDNYYQLAARRAGDLLVVSFSDPADQPRTAVEEALRQSRVHEAAARADAERARQRFYDVLCQLPAQVATYYGPDHVFAFVNARFNALVAAPRLLGRPVREASQGAVGPEVFALLDHVYATGEPVQVQELEVRLASAEPAPAKALFVNASYLPLRDAEGRVEGVLDFSYDVTEQVLARQQLQALNQELEAHVQARTTELQAALRGTEQQREQLGQILGQSPAMMATLEGPDHRFTFLNQGYAALVGHRARLGARAADCFPEMVAQGFIGLLDGVYRTGQPHVGRETPIEFQPPGGEAAQYYIDFTYQALQDQHGHTTGILAFIVDVTGQVRARHQTETLQVELLTAAQRQAEARTLVYQLFEETSASIALLRGPEHRFEYVNRAYQGLFPERTLAGSPLAEVLPDAAAQGFLALLDGVYQTGETFFGKELPLVSPSGEGQSPRTRYFDFTYQAYREAGAVAGVSIFAYDVTEQVLARQEREVQRRRLHDLFMQAPAAICILDGPDLVYELVNPGYQALFPGRDLLGKPLLDALPELAGHTAHRTFLQVYETGTTWQELGILIPLVRPDGVLEDRYFNYIQQARSDAQGHVDGVLVFAFEVTEQVLARQQAQGLAQELTTTNQQLTRTNVDLDNFIYTASHDLKAPISNIEGLLYLLKEELPAAMQQTAHVGPTLTRMLESVERFKRTIDHLTEVSKLQKEHTPATAAVNLAAVVEDVRQDLRPLLQETGAKLVIDVTALPPLHFSEKNLRSIVYNLLSNAVKYRSPDRTPYVDVRAHVRPGYTVLEVHDNGLGLAAAQLPQLFSMFQRFHDHVQGTGIGLYMVKRMVENAGGRIEVHSQLGAGTTFFVHLPHSPPA